MEEQKRFFTYIISCDDGSLYTGITTDVSKRFTEHYFKLKPCAKYTKSHQTKNIEAVFESDSKSKASKLEYYIKRLNKIQKQEIIRGGDFILGEIVYKKNNEFSANDIIQKYNLSIKK